MPSLLEEIRSQPPHIREIFMWLCVVITFSLVVYFGFKSQGPTVTALLSPQEEGSDTGLAQNTTSNNSGNESLLGSIGQSFKGFGINLSDLFSSNSASKIPFSASGAVQSQQIPASLFPTSKDK